MFIITLLFYSLQVALKQPAVVSLDVLIWKHLELTPLSSWLTFLYFSSSYRQFKVLKNSIYLQFTKFISAQNPLNI